MSSLKKSVLASLLILLLPAFYSCSKEPGTGGNSTIYGKVYVKDYNSSFTELNGEYWGQDVEVYLIFGDDRSYSEHVNTTYNGNYEFKYLRPGDYHLYCYSKDSTLQTTALVPVIRDVTINKKHQQIEVPTMTIFK
ncbi:MAG: hypothetical protein HXX13_09420 [Bacteroidetes bacterium]|nr:hypothetical protein [Bacteroidota bacterium]